MPINYQTLKISEDNLKVMFCDYFKLVIDSEAYLLGCLNRKKITSQEFDALDKKEQQINTAEGALLDEASWVISKDMPRAAHLRYIIAIIRSIKDVERMGDYIMNVASYIYRSHNLNPSITKILADAIKESSIIIKHVYDDMCSGSKQTLKYYQKVVVPLDKQFDKKYLAFLSALGKLVFKSHSKLNESMHSFTAIKNIERSRDHALNIMENFIYIKDPDYYLTKEFRKAHKEKK